MENKSGYPTTTQLPGYQQPIHPHQQPIHPHQQPIHPHQQPIYSQQPQMGFQPPPPNYNQSMGGPQPTVVITHGIPPLGPQPTQITCPSCHATVLTNVRYEPNTKTHILALILCCFICWPCVCLPYCMDSCQSGNHYCPNCNAFLGAYNKDGC